VDDVLEPLKEAVALLAEGRSLSAEQAGAAVAAIVSGQAPDSLMAAFLMGLRVKGETPEELYGCARAMRAAARTIRPRRRPLVDTCGTGGDGSHTFNISTAAALVISGAGAAVAKHGNRALSSRCGSADVLEALGLRLLADPDQVERCIDEVGFGFLFAPYFHPATRHAAGVRRALGVRTVFNLLGPLTNPAGAEGQVIGVFQASWCAPLARAAGMLGVRRCLVVHGAGGADELTLEGPVRIAHLQDGEVREEDLDPASLGFAPVPLAALRGGGAEDNAARIRSVLEGAPGPARQVVLLNAAAAAVAAEMAEDLAEGLEVARRALDSGAARERLEQAVAWTRARAS
jgi:anthranilate phosphoribosyltransferase